MWTYATVEAFNMLAVATFTFVERWLSMHYGVVAISIFLKKIRLCYWHSAFTWRRGSWHTCTTRYSTWNHAGRDRVLHCWLDEVRTATTNIRRAVILSRMC